MKTFFIVSKAPSFGKKLKFDKKQRTQALSLQIAKKDVQN